MNCLHLFLGLLAIGLSSCATKKNEVAMVEGRRDCCESPDFSIFFHPSYSDEKEELDITIEEFSDRATIRVGMAGEAKSLSQSALYRELKRKILSSSEWTEGRSDGFYNGPWMGPPRDILRIKSDGSGLNLQGASVPSSWRRDLLRLASHYE
ncbi:hypothetical protein HNR46_004293 [Haloferula luteola]|uniref:Uncharacterized protein n=1 Tax=Haloferula luteola TaxID=595692 RepID=A0A840VN34_9BACT|nr:hypothetical protein [Haloferula luteola]